METDFKNKMGELVTDLNDAMNEMNMADAAYAIGVNNMLGLISGTESQRQELVDAYADAAKAAMGWRPGFWRTPPCRLTASG